ncbi:hypothetical protein K3495_g4051 [Podosphaera aphanis]|nr:hypothetical protein K3495_g4051 [Podosphaera aphanis]
MDLEADNDTLRALAEGKAMNTAEWPGLLSRMIARLEKIVLQDFPVRSTTHSISKPTSESSPTPNRDTTDNKASDEDATQASSSDALEKEGVVPKITCKGSDEESAVLETSSTTLVPILRTIFASVTDTLRTYFSKAPPHTIQRLAELILFPRSHYRNLPSYLHALDRVVHVTSPATLFLLPPAVPQFSAVKVLSSGSTISSIDPKSIAWSNSVSLVPNNSTVGIDEALGGALLTPIPWLQKSGTKSPLENEVMRQSSTKIVEGPNGPGGVETVLVSLNGVTSATLTNTSGIEDPLTSLRSEGGITQGELLRQEQEAGVVPALQLLGEDRISDDEDSRHARGPDEIGMEDMGPQWKRGSGVLLQGIDIEAAVGRKFSREFDMERNEQSASEEPKKETVDDLEEKEKNDGDQSDQSIPTKREAPEPCDGNSGKRSKYISNPFPDNDDKSEKR